MDNYKENILLFGKGCLYSYSQVFFSRSKVLSLILMGVSFFDVWAGFSGLVAIVVANGVGIALGYSPLTIGTGIYGFNSLLVGLGLGLYFEPSVVMVLLVILSSMLTFFLVVLIQGILIKYGLPFLSIPFTLGIWMVMMASSDFLALGLSQRGIYVSNELFSMGGNSLVDLYDWFGKIGIPQSIRVYLNSLGAIFFQNNLLAGFLIAIGVLWYSRIAFSLSLLGFYVAYLFYQLIGADITSLSYTYIGFNFILTAIALGGYFIVPSFFSYLWIVLLLPMVVLFTLSSIKLLHPYGLSVYALPFNVVTLLFLYVLKLRIYPGKGLRQVLVQHNIPERNLYFTNNSLARFGDSIPNSLILPLLGEWTVSQAHNGEYTHKEQWRHAWDFIIEDQHKCQYQGDGMRLKDYHCYGKAVLAPAQGEIVNLCDHIQDNDIGVVNLEQNWGNSVVIHHGNGLYSQLSHLKPGSLRVKKGDSVKQGTVVGLCGNSGRSPYPHLHFQLQATPHIGSSTLNVSLNHFLVKGNQGYGLYCSSGPQLNQIVLRGEGHPLIQKGLNLVSGQKWVCKVDNESSGFPVEQMPQWIFKVGEDMQNQRYLYCAHTHSYAYFKTEGNLLCFINYVGSRRSLLYYLYLSLYRVHLGFYKDLVVEDQVPPYQVYKGWRMFIQDFLAPFYLYLRVGYRLRYMSKEEDLSGGRIHLEALVKKGGWRGNSSPLNVKMCITEKGIQEWEIESDNKKICVQCINES